MSFKGKDRFENNRKDKCRNNDKTTGKNVNGCKSSNDTSVKNGAKTTKFRWEKASSDGFLKDKLQLLSEKSDGVQSGRIATGFAALVVRYRWVFVGVFIALVIACGILMTQNKVVYDLTQYLPANSDMAKATQLLKEEFDDKGMAYVMVENVSTSEASSIQAQLRRVEGVATVTYVEAMNYKNGNALYTVSLVDYDSTDGSFETVERILDALKGRECYLSGQSAFSYYTRLETEESILTIGIVIVAVILLMILFTSKSYFELVIMVLVFGISVLLNMGTNFLFNGISYISNLVALVLQLALSLDYSVILLHRFIEEKKKTPDVKVAATVALGKGVKEILSGSLTTIAGLGSLLLMTLPIGVEIGLALGKGIIASLISVIFLMPALLVIFAKPLEKSEHKSFVPNITRPARSIVKARKVIVPIFLVLVVLAGVGQSYNTYSFNYNGGSKIVNAQAHMKDDFGTLNSLVVVVPKGDYDKERELAAYVGDFDIIDSTNALSCIDLGEYMDGFGVEWTGGSIYLTDSVTKAEISALIRTIIDAAMSGDTTIANNMERIIGELFDSYVLERDGIAASDESQVVLAEFLVYLCENNQLIGAFLGDIAFAVDNLSSENYSRLMFNVNSGVESADTFELIDTLKASLGEFYPEFYLVGEGVACYEMAQSFPIDNLLVSLCSVLFILVILLFTFRNISLPILLTLAIQGGIWINFAIPFLAANPVSFIGYLVITAVQIGATIDYAIVLTNRYRSEKHKFINRYDAMAASQNAVFPTIITSGIVLTITGFALSVAASGVVAQLGSLLGIGTLISMLIVLFVLPSLLLVCEKFIDKMDFAYVRDRIRKIPLENKTPLMDEEYSRLERDE